MKYFLIVFLTIPLSSFAQNTASVGISLSLPSIAILDVEPNNAPINLNLLGLTEAGNTVTVAPNATDNTKWLNFTSAVTKGSSRRISAQLSGALNGVSLKLTTANYAGTGAGTLGSPLPPILLSPTAQTVINNIGGAYTGNGQGNGYNLTYSLQIADYSLLRTQTNTVSIIFTLTDN